LTRVEWRVGEGRWAIREVGDGRLLLERDGSADLFDRAVAEGAGRVIDALARKIVGDAVEDLRSLSGAPLDDLSERDRTLVQEIALMIFKERCVAGAALGLVEEARICRDVARVLLGFEEEDR